MWCRRGQLTDSPSLRQNRELGPQNTYRRTLFLAMSRVDKLRVGGRCPGRSSSSPRPSHRGAPRPQSTRCRAESLSLFHIAAARTIHQPVTKELSCKDIGNRHWLHVRLSQAEDLRAIVDVSRSIAPHPASCSQTRFLVTQCVKTSFSYSKRGILSVVYQSRLHRLSEV